MERSAIRDMASARAPICAVVPAKAGTHNPRESYGVSWSLRVFAKLRPVVMGPGLALCAPRDDELSLVQ
ncbi:hypothetical protein ABIA45_004545 [Bradyrhizobium sp. USDA 336]|nr:hypothetical protein [Bradyrhizobium sp. CCBAU 45321]